MSLNLTYHPLRSEESHGTYGAFGIKIEVAATNLPNLRVPYEERTVLDNAITNASYDAIALIKTAIMTAIIAADPDAQKRRVAERAELVGLFPSAVLVEEIPNGYCSDWCCKHLPWFTVTTTIGRFEIGWRKRVIHLEWTETKGTKTAEELFPADNVTKGDRYIHAWSVEDARRYIDAIIGSAV